MDPAPLPLGAASDLAGRVALVTGAAGNIGRAVATALTERGADVVLADLPAAHDGLLATQDACERARAGVHVELAEFDVRDDAAVTTELHGAAERLGTPTLVLNNAGYQGAFANLIDYGLDDLRTVLEINVVGVFTVLQATARLMRDAGVGGSIVNVASMAGVSGAVNMPAYTASKSAVIGLTKSAAKDLAPLGIRVNSISPGFIGPGAMWDKQVAEQARVASQYYGDDVDTVAAQMIAMVPLRRYGTLDEVAAVATFLLSDQSSFVDGVDLQISGGSA